MFFVISKTLGIMLLPTNFLIGIALAGAALTATRFARTGRRLLVACVALLAIAGFSPLGYLLLYPLESRFPPWNAAGGAPDGVIVLGGSIDADLSAAHDVPIVTASAERIMASAALARRFPNARIIFTGGSSNLLSNDAREADYAVALFESLGISRQRLVMERRSRNTEENAAFSRELAAPKPGERWLLVTSAYHMPRSVGLFRKAGFDVEPYPVGWRVLGGGDRFAFSRLAVDGLNRTDLAVREWLGLISYRVTGKIDQLLPGPDSN